MSREVKTGAAVVDHFPVYEDDGFTKHSGLGPGDFVSTVYLNSSPIGLTVSITEIGSSGEYQCLFVPPVDGVYDIEIFNYFSEEIWWSQYISHEEESSTLLLSVQEELTRVLGLLHYNAMVDKQLYDEFVQLTDCRLRVFDTPGHVPTTPEGSETLGLLHEYAIKAEYAGQGVLKNYTLKRVL